LQAWTGASSTPVALVHMLLRLPNIKFVIVTRGEKGCVMLERSMTGEFSNETFYTRKTPMMCIFSLKRSCGDLSSKETI
jgi:sugar/nucleoside kinase (ribokinase family)